MIHRTTMTPSKLELLTSWLPSQSWYAGGPSPRLTMAGGFRLDDPSGQVGIEILFIVDQSGPHLVCYQVPLTYRHAPLPRADHFLVGASEHGVLGHRWIYDGLYDPVLVRQYVALLHGDATPQHQNESGAPDGSVATPPSNGTHLELANFRVHDSGSGLTDIVARLSSPPSSTIQIITVQVARVLEPARTFTADPIGRTSRSVQANWHLPDGSPGRGHLAHLRVES